MQKNKPYDERLQERIRTLELRRQEELDSLNHELHELREQLTPSNLIRNTFQSIKEDPSKRKKLLWGAAGVVAMGVLQRFAGKKVFSLGKALLPLIPLITKNQKKS